MRANLRERLTLTPQEAADVTGLSLATVYRAIARGELRAVKRCSRWLIPADVLREFCGTGPRALPSRPTLPPDVARVVRSLP